MLNAMQPRTVASLLLPRLRPCPIPPHLLYTLPFSTTSTSKQDKPKPGAIKEKPAGVNRESPIQTVPFQLGPAQAEEILETAAAASFGLGSVWRHVAGRILKNWFGISNVIENPIRRIAFKPLLVATWRVDFAAKCPGRIGDVQLDLLISALNAALPGFKAPPLDQLSFISQWDTEAMDYDRETHSRQMGLDITTIPFSESPINFVKELKKIPMLRESEYGIGIDPATVEPIMFAVYPVYIPIYLGEFEDMIPIEEEGPRRRLTCAAFATSTKNQFAVYPSFLENPSWKPSGNGVEISIAGSINPSSIPASGTSTLANNMLSKLKPRIDEWMSEVDATKMRVLLPLKAGEMQEEHVMKFEKHAVENEEYVEGYLKWKEVQAKSGLMHRAMSGNPNADKSKVVIVRREGIKLIKSTAADMEEELEKEAASASRELALLKPTWMRKDEVVAEQEKKPALKSRGRPIKK